MTERMDEGCDGRKLERWCRREPWAAFLLPSDRLPHFSMRASTARLLRVTMSNRAPASSPASKESLQALTKRSWRVERTSRNNADFNDCCGPSKTGDTNASAELLSKDFTFKSFKEAWRFMSDIAQAAERLKVKLMSELPNALTDNICSAPS